MPCRTPDATPQQIEGRKVAKFLRFLLPIIGKEVPNNIESYCDCYYDNADDLTPLLCDTIRSMNEFEFIDLMNNSRNPLSSMLLYWWAEHKEHDRIREDRTLTEVQKKEFHQNIRVEYLTLMEDRLVKSMIDYNQQKIR